MCKPFFTAITIVIAIACFVTTGVAAPKAKDELNGKSGNAHKEKDKHHPPPKSHPVRSSSPTQLRVEAVSDSQVNLVWCDKSSNELGFLIERAQELGNYCEIAVVRSNTTTYQDTGLRADTRYCYRVRAYNQIGFSRFSPVDCARTGPAQTNCALVVNSWGAFPSRPPTGLTDVVAVATGGYQAMALKRDGTVVGWGWDQSSPLTMPPPTNLTGVIAIGAGEWHGVALKGDGTVATWGSDYSANQPSPTNLTGVAAIAVGSHHTLALKRDGTVIGWGNSIYGEANTPTNLSGVMTIAAGGYFSLALQTNGTIVSWGYPLEGIPSQLTNAIAIAAGDYGAVALMRDGTVFSWGNFSSPAGLSNIVAISACGNTALALTGEGTVINLNDPYSGPFPPELNGVVAIAAGSIFNLALSTTPNPPRDFVAQVRATNQVTLRWATDPAARAAVQIERAFGDADLSVSSNWVQIASLPSAVATFNDFTVKAGSNYWYRARAANPCHGSIETQVSVTVAPPQMSPAFFATSFIDQARLFCYPQFSGITGVRIERAMDIGGYPGTWNSIIITNATDASVLAYIDPGLTLSNRYWYRAQVINGLGASPFSEPVNLIILPPTTPLYLDAYIARSNQVRLSWVASGAKDQDGYKLERTTNVLNGTEVWTQIATINNSLFDPSFTETNVQSNSISSYRVRAFNKLGDSPYSSALTVAITPPPPPGLSGYSRDDQAILNWSMNYRGDVERFILQRAPDNAGAPGTWTDLAALTNLTSYNYADSELTPGKTYWYHILAINWTGVSPFSLPVQITIAPPAAPNPPSGGGEAASVAFITSLVFTNDDAFVTWTAPAGSSILEISSELAGPFSSIPESLMTGKGATTGTYLDTGARTNALARFYRVRLMR